MWTLDEGIELVRSLEPLAIKSGFHVALGGSVLHKGSSEKDLDVFVYIHKTGEPSDLKEFQLRIEGLGIADWVPRPHEYQGDKKTVFSASDNDGRRIDFFIFQEGK